MYRMQTYFVPSQWAMLLTLMFMLYKVLKLKMVLHIQILWKVFANLDLNHPWEMFPKSLVSSWMEMVGEYMGMWDIAAAQIWNYLTHILLFENCWQPRSLTGVRCIQYVNFKCSALHKISFHVITTSIKCLFSENLLKV